MNSTRRRTGAVAFLMAAALTAGCGQKAGVAEMYAGQAAAGAAQGLGAPAVPGADGFAATGPDGAPLAAGGAGVAGSGGFASSGSGGAGAGTSAGTGGGRSGGSRGGGGGGEAPPVGEVPQGPGDTTGVTDTTIKIGVHAPVTGAAAIPQQSFADAVGVYFDYVNRNGGIHGRKIEVVFEDDKFSPTVAVTKCKKMVEQDKVFLLVGGAGSDQIDQCARYAASAGVPYLSAGVHESRPTLGSLADLDTYFALSLTYEQQAPLVAGRMADEAGGEKVGLVVASNDSLNSYFAAQKGAIQRTGLDLAYEARIPKDASAAEATTYATAICQNQLTAVAWNASPSVFLNVVKQMPCTGVRFFGPGLTNGLNIVTQVGCPQINGSEFYSPFPGMDVMRQDQQFVSAYQQKNGDAPDDIGAAIWGMEKLVGAILQANGRDLSRQSFMATIASRKVFETGVYPTTNFTSRFGGTAMHRLIADCGRSEWVTAKLNERP